MGSITLGNDRIVANGFNQSPIRNAIINGGFQVNQRAVSGTVVLSAGAYGHDRWKAGASGCTYTFATVENVTTITISAGSLIQVIEGLNLETSTYVLSWNGTAQGKIGAGSYGASGITGSVVGGTNLSIEFNTGTLSKVRFNKGTVPVEWQTEAYADVLRQCRRYYKRFAMGQISETICIMFPYNVYAGRALLPLEVPMRKYPSSIGYYGNWVISKVGVHSKVVTSMALVANEQCENYVVIEIGVYPNTAETFVPYNLQHSNDATAYIEINAEL